jgi:predicted ATPase/transcriptional regulator with XRE-family HTH domain
MIDLTFGEWLKRRRGALGLTQEQLAQQLGCSTIALRKIEAEERRPSPQIVERLAEVLGVGPQDRSAFLRFARGDWQAAPAAELASFPWRTARSNLPAPLTSLIGREHDVAAVHSYLLNPDIRLITLIGPPGIGKTRLSVRAATEALPDFPAGVFFVALETIEDETRVAPAIAHVLGLEAHDRRSDVERLTDSLGQRRLLLVLDNFEQIIQAAPLVSDLLSACSQMKIIVTSREALRVPGEWQYPVPPLAVPEAQQPIALDGGIQSSALTLFAERARAYRPDFALNVDNVQAVATLCRQLDGLPLAIELLASRIRWLSPQAMVAQLADAAALHVDGMRGVPNRQKKLFNAIDWSYQLLTDEEQCVLAALSVFSGGFTLEAAAALQPSPGNVKPVTEYVLSLADKCLVQRADGLHDEPRFRLLVVIREFALDRLRERNEEATLRDRHAAYFLDFAGQADREIHGPQQVDWLDRLELEHDNYYTALEWCVSRQRTETALRLMGALNWMWRLRGYWDEACEWFAKVRVLPDVAHFPAANVKVLNGMGRQNWALGDYAAARAVLEESRDIGLTLGMGGEAGLAGALDFLGMVARYSENDLDGAEAFHAEAVALYRKADHQWGMAEATFHLGLVASDRQEYALALSYFETSLKMFRQLGDLWGFNRLYTGMGVLFLQQGDLAKARATFEQMLMGEQQIRHKPGVIVALLYLGDVHRHEGNYQQAGEVFQTSLALSREYGFMSDIVVSLGSLGQVALHQDDTATARTCFVGSLTAGMKLGSRIGKGENLAWLAAVAASCQQPDRAARLSGAAQAIFEVVGWQMAAIDRTEIDRRLQIAREQLGEERFAALQAEGRALTLEQAIDLALQVTN